MKRSLLLVICAGLLAGICPVFAAENPSWNEEEIIFPIGGYSGKPLLDKEEGFTLVGPAYRGVERTFAEAQEAGLPAFYRIGVAVDFHGRNGPPPRELDFDAIRAEVRRQVEAVAHHDEIVGWYLTREELRYWRKLEMEYLKEVSETIRQSDPKQRPVWMYEPGHRTRRALEKTAPYLQVMGKGIYTNYSGRKNERIWVRWTLAEQQAAIDTANPEAVAYAVPEMFQEPEEPHLIPTWVRHDGYTALLGGVRGMVIFSFARRKGFRSRDLYYNEYASLARELNGPLKLGSVFLKGKLLEAPAFEITEGDKETTLSGGPSGPLEAVILPSLATKALAWRDGIYLFIVNSSPNPVELRLEHAAPWQPLLTGQPHLEADRRTLKLPAFGVAAFKRPRGSS